MNASLIKNIILPGTESNYFVGGNVTNAFAIGEIGSEDDFFLVGMEPEEGSNEPALTGTILDSVGKVLFKIENNTITVNPGRCSQIIGTGMGYEIRDLEGKEIMKVSTRFEEVRGVDGETYVTTISGDFYNKKGELVFKARSGDADEKIETNVKLLIGITNNSTGLSLGYSENQVNYVRAIIGMKKILRVLEGELENQSIELNGCALFDTKISNCNLTISGGKFVFLGHPSIVDCNITFAGEALQVAQLAARLGYKLDPNS